LPFLTLFATTTNRCAIYKKSKPKMLEPGWWGLLAPKALVIPEGLSLQQTRKQNVILGRFLSCFAALIYSSQKMLEQAQTFFVSRKYACNKV